MSKDGSDAGSTVSTRSSNNSLAPSSKRRKSAELSEESGVKRKRAKLSEEGEVRRKRAKFNVYESDASTDVGVLGSSSDAAMGATADSFDRVVCIQTLH